MDALSHPRVLLFVLIYALIYNNFQFVRHKNFLMEKKRILC